MKHPNNTRRPARRWGALAVLALAGGLTLDALAQQVCNPRLQRTRVDARYESVAGAYPAGSEVRDKVTEANSAVIRIRAIREQVNDRMGKVPEKRRKEIQALADGLMKPLTAASMPLTM